MSAPCVLACVLNNAIVVVLEQDFVFRDFHNAWPLFVSQILRIVKAGHLAVVPNHIDTPYLPNAQVKPNCSA
jgi:hypothetical protein